MGRVRTKTVKRASRQIVEKYHNKLTCDFQVNKKIADEVAQIPSKRLRNKIAGFVTHLMKRVKKGHVRGISLAVQQAERERRMDVMPEISITESSEPVNVDPDTYNMLMAAKVSFSVAKMVPEPAKNQRGGPRGQRFDRNSTPGV